MNKRNVISYERDILKMSKESCTFFMVKGLDFRVDENNLAAMAAGSGNSNRLIGAVPSPNQPGHLLQRTSSEGSQTLRKSRLSWGSPYPPTPHLPSAQIFMLWASSLVKIQSILWNMRLNIFHPIIYI